MPVSFDLSFDTDKRISEKSGRMFNKYQRAYIRQFELKEQEDYYRNLDEGKLGKLPQDIPEHLH